MCYRKSYSYLQGTVNIRVNSVDMQVNINFQVGNDELPKPESGDLEWKAVIDNFDAANDFITNDGADFYFMTTKNAPKYKVIKVNVDTLEGTTVIDIDTGTNTKYQKLK